jgi:hypothetical protein
VPLLPLLLWAPFLIHWGLTLQALLLLLLLLLLFCPRRWWTWCGGPQAARWVARAPQAGWGRG